MIDCGRTGCAGRHCTACARDLGAGEPYVCTGCVASVRRCIGDILTAAALLPGQAYDGNGAAALEPKTSGSREQPGPGGDALVAAGPGSMDADGTDHVDGDVESVHAVLAGWEDRFRKLLSQPGAWGRPDAVSSARWLGAHLRSCAAVPPVRSVTIEGRNAAADLEASGSGHAFVAMARHLRQLRARVEQVTAAGSWPIRARATCLECGEDELVFVFDDPRPCRHVQAAEAAVPADAVGRVERVAATLRWIVRDPKAAAAKLGDEDLAVPHEGCRQGGRRDSARCRACGRPYTEAEYFLAVKQRLEAKAVKVS